MAYEKTQYDVALEDIDGTQYGLTLVKDKNNQPIYRESGDPALSNQIMVGEADYAHLDSEKLFTLLQDDWRAGFGRQFYDGRGDEAYRYYQSFGVDARFGGLLPGPLPATVIQALTDQVAPSITNADMELNSDWTGGAQSETGEHGGTYSWSTGVGDTTAYQDLTWSDDYQDKYFIFYGYMSGVEGKQGRLVIIDDEGTTNGDTFTAVSTSVHVLVWVIRKIHKDADSQLRVQMESIGTDTVYWDDVGITGQALTSQLLSCVSFAEFDTDLYVGIGNVLTKLSKASGAVLDYLTLLPAEITDLKTFPDDRLYIAQGGTNNYFWLDTDDALHSTANANAMADYFQTVNVTMWKAVRPRELKSTTTPHTDTSWSGSTTVDNSENNINELRKAIIGGVSSLIIMKADMPYYLDADFNVQSLIPSLASEKASTSGKNTIAIDGKLYIPCGNQNLTEYERGEATNLSPAGFTSDDSNFTGKVQAMANDADYKYAICDDGDDIHILAGRWEIVNGYPDWRWHPIATIADFDDCETAFTSTVFKKRLWIASSTAAKSIYYIPLPTEYGNVAADTDLAFETGGYLIEPWQHVNLKGDLKAWIKSTLTMANVDATNYWSVSYQKWGDSGWTACTGDFGDDEATTHTEYHPDEDSNKPQSIMFRRKFTCTSDGAAPAPQILSTELAGIWYPSTDIREGTIISLQATIADNTILKSGAFDSQTESDSRSFLEGCRRPTTAWPITFYPPYWKSSSDDIKVKLIEPFDMRMTKMEKVGDSYKFEWLASLTFEVVKLE